MVRLSPGSEVDKVAARLTVAKAPVLAYGATRRPEQPLTRPRIVATLLAEAIPAREVILTEGQTTAVLATPFTPGLPIPAAALTPGRRASPAPMGGRGPNQVIPPLPKAIAAR